MIGNEHIQKRHKISVAARAQDDAAHATLRRIPMNLVGLLDASEAGTTLPTGHVVRRSEAQIVARPFELQALASLPSYPLANERADPVDEEAERAKHEAEWQARLDREVAAAEKAGYEKGYAAAESAMRAETDAARAAFIHDAGQLKACWEEFTQKTEPLLAHLALTMTQTILDAPLSPEVQKVAARSLSTAIDRLATDPPIQISLHPVDLLRLRESGIVDELEASHEGLQWDPDEAMHEGGWVVQSPVAMIRHLKAELAHTLRTQLGLPDLDTP